MDDQTITRLCAEAMGYNVNIAGRDRVWVGAHDGAFPHIIYDPLHDKAQAMELVIRFKLDVEAPLHDGLPWTVSGGDDTAWSGPVAMTHNPNLLRAICECVAKMRQAKQGNIPPRG